MNNQNYMYLILTLIILEGFTVSYSIDILVPLQAAIQDKFKINMTEY